MSVLGGGRGRGGAGRPPRAKRPRRLVTALLAATLATGCEAPFDPFQENAAGPFSVYGYLDLKADTQWIRVMPVRQDLVPDSAPIDAVVTLEHLGSGRVVTLRDSLFTYRDPGLDGVAYAHNFWTTEPIEPEATYRLVAMRSDGAATTALVEMPPDLVVSLVFWQIPRNLEVWRPRQFVVQGEHLLYADVIYTVWDTSVDRAGPPLPVRQDPVTVDPGRWGFVVPPDPLDMPPFTEVGRREVQIAVAGSDWPYEHGLSATDLTIPGAIPSTVENGVGSLVGVATWRIPLPLCVPIETDPDGSPDCDTEFDASSASIVGKVTGDPCSDPMRLPTLRLTERYADGGAVVWEWKPDWGGTYRFEGLRPGADLRLEVVGHPAQALDIPPLGPGERYVAPDVTLFGGC